mgnify:CR=1 FL=1
MIDAGIPYLSAQDKWHFCSCLRHMVIRSFSSTWKKTNQKKTPVSRFILRVGDAAGARGNSSRFQRDSDSPRAFSGPLADARRGTKGLKTKTPTSFLENGGSILWMPCVHAIISPLNAIK